MDEPVRAQAARTYNTVQKVIYVRGLIAAIVLGAVFTAVGVLIDLRSGVVGTLILGVVLLVGGVVGLVLLKPFFARRDRQVAAFFDVPRGEA